MIRLSKAIMTLTSCSPSLKNEKNKGQAPAAGILPSVDRALDLSSGLKFLDLNFQFSIFHFQLPLISPVVYPPGTAFAVPDKYPSVVFICVV